MASEEIRNNKELVRFLVWSNPSNLCDPSPALQADPDIVFTALQSPYYWEEHPKTSFALVLLNASEELRKQRCLALSAVALNGYEMQFVGEELRADPYVVAWAGAPKGAGASMLCGKELVRFMNSLPESGMSVSHVVHIYTDNWPRSTGLCNITKACGQQSLLYISILTIGPGVFLGKKLRVRDSQLNQIVTC